MNNGIRFYVKMTRSPTLLYVYIKRTDSFKTQNLSNFQDEHVASLLGEAGDRTDARCVLFAIMNIFKNIFV